MFQQAITRANDASAFGSPIIVAGADHCNLIEQQLASTQDYTLIVEPCARNTAPAIALAASQLPEDAIMLVCPSDHYIADEDAFRKTALAAAELAREDWLVSFGITPDHPETGYGYLQRGEELSSGYKIRKFVEKPDSDTARAGDTFYLPAGTVHAIGPGLSLLEVQQNSETTFRMYDYGRPRELHLESAMAVADCTPYLDKHQGNVLERGTTIIDGPFFRIERLEGLPTEKLCSDYVG